jgi:succinate dehydrogenase/fumarate reductase flavoprotein subunit
LQHDFDLVVVGSGAGALLGAIRAADLGLKPLVIEKTASSAAPRRPRAAASGSPATTTWRAPA